MNSLPKELAQIVFDYCDPWKEAHKRIQKQNNRSFAQMRKMTIYTHVKLYRKFNDAGYPSSISDICFTFNPTVKEMLQFPVIYTNEKKNILEYLKNN